MITKNLLSHLNLNIKNISPAHGGDINEAYYIKAEEGDFFIKVNSAQKYPKLIEKEANGLKALAETNTIKTPDIIATGNFEDNQYLLLKRIISGNTSAKAWESFGQQLAAMHKISQPHFGFREDNYLGTYFQKNNICDNWAEFYGNYRIIPLIELLYNENKIEINSVNAADHFTKELTNIFPAETPSLLHGDLWSGNYIINQNGEAVLIDPAVYYGHREMDIGMSHLFEGFAPQFYEAYNNSYPLEKNWEKRLAYTQLYPLLFHAHAFGGHYIQSIKNILKPFTKTNGKQNYKT